MPQARIVPASGSQEVVDCSTSCSMAGGNYECNGGCKGGWPWAAYLDIAAWKGVNTETAYPYKAKVCCAHVY